MAVLLDIVGSRVRYAVLLTLAKAYKLKVPVSPRAIVRVFGLNIPNTYSFMRKLVEVGLIMRTGSKYMLTEKGAKLVDFVLELVPKLNDGFDELRATMPETMYYVVEPKYKEWFGVYKPLVMVDKALRNRDILVGGNYVIVYVSFRGKVFKYDWDRYLSLASVEQAYADLISYDDQWISYIPDILLNLFRLDVEEVLKRATYEGRRRLATALAYYETFLGRKVPLRTDVYSLLDEKLLDDMIAFVTPLLIDERGLRVWKL